MLKHIYSIALSGYVKRKTADSSSSPLLKNCPYPLWKILHFTNPLDNDTLWSPCNMPLGVYLAMWAAMFMVTSLPVKNYTSRYPLTLWMADKICQVSVTQWARKKLTSCDTQKSRKKNIIKQLNGTEHNVLPPPNKSWLGYRPCRITVSHHQVAAQQLTAYNRAKASLWSPYG